MTDDTTCMYSDDPRCKQMTLSRAGRLKRTSSNQRVRAHGLANSWCRKMDTQRVRHTDSSYPLGCAAATHAHPFTGSLTRLAPRGARTRTSQKARSPYAPPRYQPKSGPQVLPLTKNSHVNNSQANWYLVSNEMRVCTLDRTVRVYLSKTFVASVHELSTLRTMRGRLCYQFGFNQVFSSRHIGRIRNESRAWLKWKKGSKLISGWIWTIPLPYIYVGAGYPPKMVAFVTFPSKKAWPKSCTGRWMQRGRISFLTTKWIMHLVLHTYIFDLSVYWHVYLICSVCYIYRPVHQLGHFRKRLRKVSNFNLKTCTGRWLWHDQISLLTQKWIIHLVLHTCIYLIMK